MLAGTDMPGENPFAPSGQLGAEPLAYAEAALDASVPGREPGPFGTIGLLGRRPVTDRA